MGDRGKATYSREKWGGPKIPLLHFPRAIATEDGSPHITWIDMCDEPPSMSAGDQIYTTKSQLFRYFILVKRNVHFYRRRVADTTFETQTQLLLLIVAFFCFETLI